MNSEAKYEPSTPLRPGSRKSRLAGALESRISNFALSAWLVLMTAVYLRFQIESVIAMLGVGR